MRKSLNWILFTIFGVLGVAVMVSCENECVQGQVRECSCPSGAQGQQICLNYKGDWEECRCKGDGSLPSDSDSETPTDTSIDGGSTDDLDGGTDSEIDSEIDSEADSEIDSEADSEQDTAQQDTAQQDTGTQKEEDAGVDTSL